MAPRSAWKGFLNLNLVSMPVKAYTAANSSKDIKLNQLHAKDGCHSRIRYHKVCEEHGRVGNDEIVKGFEYSKDQYAIIEPEEIEMLRTEKDKTVRITGFVNTNEVDSIFLSERTYYLVPDGAAGQKAYALLFQGMSWRSVHAIAEIVLAGRKHVVLLKPYKNLLAMSVLRYESSLKTTDAFKDEVGTETVSNEELALTQTLIDATMIENFDFSSYKDDYNEKLEELVQMKIDGKEVVQTPKRKESQVINLVESLKKSIEAAQA